MKLDETDYLAHYGIIRRSGRYPWGSGGEVKDIRNKDFPDFVNQLKRDGLTESQIAQGFGMSINELRAVKSIESNANRAARVARHQRLRDKGYSTSAIARTTGHAESVVRNDLSEGSKDRVDILTNTANMLRKEVDEKGMVDVSKGSEHFVGVSRTRMDTAIAVLKQEGYVTRTIKSPQVTVGHDTTTIVLAKPGTEWKDVINNRDKIQPIGSYSSDGGRNYSGKLHEPIAINPKRVAVVYGPDGGTKADGIMYIRPGKDDISIGGSKYAQVRVAIGPDHYLKGMAIYKDDLPPGVDIRFFTNKKDTGNKLDAMKKNADEPGYVPGSSPHPLLKSIKRQILADPGGPNERVTSAMNLVNEEGKWEEWSHELSSQMLSKQSPKLAKTQLDITYARRQQEFDEINSLTNATVRKKMLLDFADSTDSAAVHLKAAALPRTGTHVILPLSTIKQNEIFAPNYDHGEKVVLIRHPHGGVFEIPELVVNNRNKEGRKLLGDSRDAVGIHHKVAEWLSGADFDGDTVLVIPNSKERIKHSKALDDLKDFDPKSSYPGYPGMKTMKNTQREMGEISNLITDMSLQGAPHSDIARAVRHSMVVIDAEKHGLNYKQSEADNGIKQLKQKYQTGGASTLISRARSEKRIDDRKPRPMAKGGPINTKTGELEYVPTGKTNYKTGKPKQIKVAKLADTNDAHTLMSTPTGTVMERLYADHSNRLKGMANQARLAAVKTRAPKMSPSAKKTHKAEVDSLNSKLLLAERNAPLERHAQRIANAVVKAKRDANPDMDRETEKKVKYQALTQARARMGAEKQRIEITHEEWNAIQAGAISNSKLEKILNNANMDVVRSHATPKSALLMTSDKTSRAKGLLDLGYTRLEVARILGVSKSTLDAAVK